MKKLVAIVAGDPESINTEIIAKMWKRKKLFKNLNIFVIGNYNLIKKQLKFLKIKIKLGKIDDLNKIYFKKKLLVYDVPFSFKSPFNFSKNLKKDYVIKSLNILIKFSKYKKIFGLINCSIIKMIFLIKHGCKSLLLK